MRRRTPEPGAGSRRSGIPAAGRATGTIRRTGPPSPGRGATGTGYLRPMTFAIAFTIYTLAIVAVGVWSSRYARASNEDYFLAGRGLGPWVAALSASASSESGWVTLGLVGLGFRNGAAAFWLIPGCLLGYLVNWFVIASRLRTRSEALGAVTVPDFFALHFRERRPILRLLTVTVIMLAMWMYVAAQFAAAGKAFHSAFDISYPLGVVIGAGIVLVYTVLGGFRATCWTDAVQAILMVGALVVFPIFLLDRVGGLGAVGEATGGLADGAYLHFWPDLAGFALIGFLLGSGALGINLGFLGQPHVLVRFMALRDRREAITAGFVSLAWGALVLGGAAATGILCRAGVEMGLAWAGPLATDAATGSAQAGEVALVVAAQQLLPGVASGLILAAVLAAMCSTADSQLVVAASAGAHDVHERLLARGGGRIAGLMANRLVVAILGLGAIALVIDQEVQVYGFVLDYAWAVLGAAIGPQLLLVLLWRRASYAGCIAGMATGLLVPLAWKQLEPMIAARVDDWVPIYNLTLAFTLALATNLVVSIARPDREPRA